LARQAFRCQGARFSTAAAARPMMNARRKRKMASAMPMVGLLKILLAWLLSVLGWWLLTDSDDPEKPEQDDTPPGPPSP
jgi:hypothetical protein